MGAVFAVDAGRTPVGKIKGALAGVRPDHLAADVISALVARNPWLDPESIDDVYWGAARCRNHSMWHWASAASRSSSGL